MSHKDQIKSAAGIGGLVSLYGIASLLVIVIGPQFGFGWAEQIILIALILLTWPFAILITRYRAKRQQRQSAEEAEPNSSKQKKGNAPAPVYTEITRSAEEAVQWLRSTKLGAKKSRDAVYSLPWFVVAGAEGSGKTSLLLSSGLDYHALPSQRRAEQNFIRPTRDCQWRVTDSAVLLDTSGRYQTDGQNADEWVSLIETIKKYRKDRPLDGLLITASLYEIFNSNESEIERQAKLLRARLDELIEHAQIKFPVYLVFTNADAIEGFDEFFATLATAERAQVWGATIPIEESQKAHALFDVEFDYLYDSLMRRRLIRLSEQETSADQLLVFDFPSRFAEARRRLGHFTSALFRPTPLRENPWLRGFYFTSSIPADLAQRKPSTEDGDLRPAQEAGEGIFTEHLFKDVLMRDKDLAAYFQSSRAAGTRWRNISIGAAAAALLFILIGLVASFSNNSALIADAKKIGYRVDQNTKANTARTLAANDPALLSQLEEIDKLRETLVALDERKRDWPPLYINTLFYRFGLYSGNSLDSYLRAIYFEAINDRFFKSTRAALENDLRSFQSPSGQPSATGATNAPATSQASAVEDKLGQYYDLLKAYLMLSTQAERAEPSFLVSQLRDYWRRSAPEEAEATALKQLEFFADQAAREDAPHLKADSSLVAEARVKLEDYPAVYRYFKRVTTEIAAKVQPITLDAITKKGVLEGAARVSGSFTLDGYKQMLDAIDSAPKKMSEEDWVMGESAAKSKDQTANVSELKGMYAQKYVDAWKDFLKEIRVKDFTGPEQAASALKELSANSSPLAQVLKAVARQTNIAGGGSSFWSKLNPFSGSKSESAVASQVDKEFRPIIDFAEGKKDPDPLSLYLKSLTEARDLLNGATGDQWAQTSKTLLVSNDPKSFQKTEKSAQDLLAEMQKSSAGTEAAKLLEQPFGNIRAIVVGDMREQIEKEWTEKLYPIARALESGYPFKDASAEASLTDLAKFLNPVDGQLTVFFKEKLESSFDEAGSELKPKEGRLKFSDSFVAYLNNARRLRAALFQSGGKQPDFTYVLTLQVPSGSNSLVEIQSDGSRVDTQNAEQNFKWTGAAGTKITVANAAPVPFSGPWCLFKMFEAGHPSRGADNRYQLAWRVGSTTVQAKLQPPSPVSNPFELKIFRDMRAPASTR